MKLARSPLAPARFPLMPPIDGVRFAVRNSGLRYKGRPDVLFLAMEPGTAVAGVFTTSKTASAPVLWCREGVKGGAGRGLVVNAGNANAFTGEAGMEAVRATAETAAEVLGCAENEIFLSSTGTIGEPLDAAKITAILGEMHAAMDIARWEDAAGAIMTTDTFAKGSSRSAEIGGTKVTINGIAKGSGMIAPDMATMLSYVFTDAALPAEVLQTLLSRGVDRTFNCITVDSDTSTSDTLMAFATGKAGNPQPDDADDPALADFAAAFEDLLRDLAHQIVRDGEGATKFVTVRVLGAENDPRRQAHRPVDRQLAAGQDRGGGRRSQLGPHRHGGRQVGRSRRPRQAEDRHRRLPGGRERHAHSRLRRNPGRRLYERRGGRVPGRRRRRRTGQGHRLDL